MATHSSILAWEIPWAKEPGGLQTRVRHDLATKINNKQIKYAQREIRGINVNLSVVSIEMVVLRS